MPHVIPKPDSEPEDFARFTHSSWRDLDSTYQFWLVRWKRAIEYVRSQHWNAMKKYDPDSMPTWKRFPVVNYTLAFYTDYLSDFLKSEIRYTAVPASPDPKDISSAELVEQLDSYLWDKLDMNTKRIQLASWLLTCGTAYLRVFWDTNTGKMLPLALPDPQSGELIPVDPETGRPNPEMEEPIMVDQGEIGIEVVSPQYVRFSPIPAHGAMLGLLLSREEAASLYGEKAEDLNYTSSYQDFDSNLHAIETPETVPSKDERALVIQHYIPKSSIFPDGQWWTSAAGKHLLNGPYPLPGGEIPIVPFVWVPVPGNPNVGISPLYDVTFSNKVYDEIMARVLEWHNKVKPKVLLKTGGGLTYGDINEEPFQELVVNPGAEPEFMETNQAPSTFFQSMEDAQADMMMVSGNMLSTKQQGLGAGEATNRFRQPTEPTEAGPTAVAIMNSKAGWEAIGRLIPAFAANFYTEPRVIAIQGPDRNYQWKEFIGAVDLKDISATIRVDEISLYPWSRASLRDTVSAVLDSTFGQILFMNEDGSPNMDRLNAAMSATGIDSSIPSLDPDIVEARNEHMAFQEVSDPQDAQNLPQPQFWQNHGAHLDEHEKILKSMSFNAWPEPGQQAFLQHVQQTGEFMNQAAEEEQESQIEMERRLREARETEELKANIKEMIAEAMVESVREIIAAQIPAEPGGGKSGSSE